MRTLAICAASFRASVRKAAGVEPITSPPLSVGNFQPYLLEGWDFIYIKLHGLADQPYWYGDGWMTACTHHQIRAARLRRAVVFAPTCFLPESTMLLSLLIAGARAVVGGAGQNYAATTQVQWADSLGQAFRRLLQTGLPPFQSFLLARKALSITAAIRRRYDPYLADTLDFRYYDHQSLGLVHPDDILEPPVPDRSGAAGSNQQGTGGARPCSRTRPLRKAGATCRPRQATSSTNSPWNGASS